MMGDEEDGCVPSKLQDELEFSSQPATQPLCSSFNDTGDDDDADDSMSADDEKVWGMLYPYRPGMKPVELSLANVSVGRSTACSAVLGPGQLPTKILNCVSKLQFEIHRSVNGTVELHDKSTNGTFVGNKKVGKGRKRILEHNSFIGLEKIPLYCYMSTHGDYQEAFPPVLRHKYVVSKELGRGACGIVRLAFRRHDGLRFAVKTLDKNKVNQPGSPINMMSEVNLLKKVNHPCVVCLEEVIETNDNLHIFLELADGGELFDKIMEKKRFKEPEAKLYFYQMLSAINYLHSINIVHRDLKPENMLLCSTELDFPVLKIADMGLSKLAEGTVLKTFCGTPFYLAPEMLFNKIHKSTYDNKVDMWALGVILFIMLSGYQPFRDRRDDNKPLVKQIDECDVDYNNAIWREVSAPALDLVKKLIKRSPNERLSAGEALAHPWMDDKEMISKAEKIMATQVRSVPLKRTVGDKENSSSTEENRAVNSCKRVRLMESCDLNLLSSNDDN